MPKFLSNINKIFFGCQKAMSKTENQKNVFSKLCLKVKSVNDSRLCGWRPWAGSITTRTLEGRLAEPAKEFFEIPTTTRESLYRISRMKKLNFLMHYLRDDLVSGYIDAVPLWTYNVSYKAYLLAPTHLKILYEQVKTDNFDTVGHLKNPSFF